MFCTVTGQTAVIRLFLRERLKTNNLADIAPAINVERTRTVAGLATMAIFQSRLEVGSTLEILLEKLLVTGLANIDSDVLSCRVVLWRRLLLLILGGSCPDDEKQNRSQ